MKTKTFKITLRVLRANVTFAEGMDVGVLATTEVSFNLPDDYSESLLEMSIDNYRRQIVAETIRVDVEELT